ncbi:MAG: DUF402 domain-containing protein [Acidilobaceae archaeon]
MLARVRVRGIYATALSLLLLEKGFLLADVSEVLKSRLNRPTVEGPAEVTVKNLEEDRDLLLVLGNPWEVGEKVEEAILNSLSYVSRIRGKLGVNTVVDVRSLGECRAEGPNGIEVQLEPPCPEPGSMIRSYIVREAFRRGEKPLAKPGVAVVGLYASVFAPGSGVSFSEHIKDLTRASQLGALAKQIATEKGVHIRFRSNSKFGDLADISEEIETLMLEAERILSEPLSNEPQVIKRGEFISLIGLTSTAKQILDEVRSRVCPTVFLHHSIKSGGDLESTSVDVLEEALKMGLADKKSSLALISRTLSLNLGKKIVIEHKYPDGEKISLGPFVLESYEIDESKIEMKLSRIFTKPGVLDGLGLEKRPGDYSITRVSLNEWHIVHEYYKADGKLLGVYANVNSPPELSNKGIKYVDFYVDVVKRAGEEPKIIDKEALEEAYTKGLITRAIYERVLEEAEKLYKKLRNV